MTDLLIESTANRDLVRVTCIVCGNSSDVTPQRAREIADQRASLFSCPTGTSVHLGGVA